MSLVMLYVRPHVICHITSHVKCHVICNVAYPVKYHFRSCQITCHVILHVMSGHVMSCHVMTWHVMSIYVISYVLSCHMSCHVMSWNFIPQSFPVLIIWNVLVDRTYLLTDTCLSSIEGPSPLKRSYPKCSCPYKLFLLICGHGHLLTKIILLHSIFIHIISISVIVTAILQH